MFTPRDEHSLLFRRIEGRTENFTPGDNFTPRGQIRPLGSKFALGEKLSMGHVNNMSFKAFEKLSVFGHCFK
jgi:hypothetical protein